MHIFIFHRDLRLQDNTTLIKQFKNHKEVVPIFIFPPEQIDPKKNNYFSNNSVQFMIESLHELSENINHYSGKFYFFKGDTLKVLKSIHNIESIGFNIDYTPYAKKRDNEIKLWCEENKIICYMEEDYALNDIINGQTKKKDNTPYQVFTPFKNYCMNNLKIRSIDNFKKFKFNKIHDLDKNKYIINEKDIDKFYIANPNINVHGGRKNGLKILSSLDKFKDYQKERDYLTYKTTFLGAHNHFSTVSIREVYFAMIDKLGKHSGLINELYWRDFYMNITHYFPHILHGQISGKNKSYKEKYDKLSWSNNNKIFDKFCKGETGFPIIDAGIKQLLTSGFVHNRVRMIHANFLTKDLHIDWRKGEEFYAKNLVDYSPMQNNGGWQWAASTGTDSQPYYRIFNPWSQVEKYDKKLEYIRKYLPELDKVPDKDIINWYKPEVHDKWLTDGIKYFKPIIDHNEERKKTLHDYKAIG
jgi:deoxyribodipyrimidine photo-lyase